MRACHDQEPHYNLINLMACTLMSIRGRRLHVIGISVFTPGPMELD